MPSTPAATSDMLRLLREGRGVVVGRRAGIEEWLLAGGASVWTLHGGGAWGGPHRPKKKAFGEAFSPLGLRG